MCGVSVSAGREGSGRGEGGGSVWKNKLPPKQSSSLSRFGVVGRFLTLGVHMG